MSGHVTRNDRKSVSPPVECPSHRRGWLESHVITRTSLLPSLPHISLSGHVTATDVTLLSPLVPFRLVLVDEVRPDWNI